MTVTINKKTYEAGELVAYVEKLEKENAELKTDYEVLSCSVGDFDKLQDKLEEEQRKNNGLSDNLTQAKEIIKRLMHELVISNRPYDEVELLVKDVEQFLKEVSE